MEKVGGSILSTRAGRCKLPEAESMALLLEPHGAEHSQHEETPGQWVKPGGEASCAALRILRPVHGECPELSSSSFQVSYL